MDLVDFSQDVFEKKSKEIIMILFHFLPHHTDLNIEFIPISAP